MGPTHSSSILNGKNDEAEEIFLIWLDQNVNIDVENLRLQERLRKLFRNFEVFDEIESFLKFLHDSSKQTRIFLIVSGRFGQQIVSKIHRSSKISSIFVYCSNKQVHEKWASNYSKIQSIVTNFDDLIGDLRTNRVRRMSLVKDISFSFEIYRCGKDQRSKSNVEFAKRVCLINCLSKMTFGPSDRAEMISTMKNFTETSSDEAKFLEEIDSLSSFDWFERNSIICRILNKCLKVRSLEVLRSIRFGVRDLFKEISRTVCSTPVEIFRRQIVSDEDLTILENCQGDIISLNTFFFGSTKHDETSDFDYFPRVFFRVRAETQNDEFSLFSRRDESIFFSIGALFRIEQVSRCDSRSIFVDLKLISIDDPDLTSFKIFFDNLFQGKTFGRSTFADVLTAVGLLKEPEKFYENLLEQLSSFDRAEKAQCLFSLANLATEKNLLERGVDFHQQAAQIRAEIYNENHPLIAESLSALAELEQKRKLSRSAIDLYEKALNIWRKQPERFQYKIATTFNNLGCLYGEINELQKSLEFYQDAAKIIEQFSPNDLFFRGQNFHNTAVALRQLERYDSAIELFLSALKVKTKHFHPKHLGLVGTLRQIAQLHEQILNFDQAKKFYQQIAEIYRTHFPPEAPENIQIKQDLQRIEMEVRL